MSQCVTFNKINTYKWFKDNVYHVSDDPAYDSHDRAKAFDVLMKPGKIPLGILYQETRPTLESLTIKDAPAIAGLAIEDIPEKMATIQNQYR